ncbi:hypothetical protein SOPP22_15545 [Shewanella sp. OPT22]|nr:hypothetical protein SOPP22_15545 [Shewanella sp. OPT22]
MHTLENKLVYKPSAVRQVIDFLDLKYSVSVSRLNLLVAIGLAAFYNPLLWHYLLTQEHVLTLEGGYFVIAFVIALIAIFYAALSLISFEKVQKTATVCIIFIAAATSFFMSHYGTVIGTGLMQHITDSGFNGFLNEIKVPFLLHMFLLGVFPSFLISQAEISYESRYKYPTRTGLSVVTGLLIGVLALLPQYHDFTGFFKQHKDLKCRIVPANVLYYTSSYFSHLIPKEYKKFESMRKHQSLITAEDTK